MDVRIEDVSSVEKKLSFEIDAEQVNSELEKAYRKMSKKAKVKGFRAGKIPRSVLEQYYAPQVHGEVLQQLVNDSFFKALVDHKINAVSGPQIVESDEVAKGQPFSYAVKVEIKPEVEVKGYAGVKVQKERFEMDPEVVSTRLEEMRQGRAQLEASGREEAASGDFVEIDFEGFVDGEAFEGGKAEGHQLELGSGSFIPGFEEQVEGMKRGETKDVEVTFPEEYGNKELAGKPATFKVSLKEIKEKVVPELDDEFAKEFGLESLDELKEKLEESYRQQEQNRIDGDLREKLISQLIEANPFEVPSAMVEKQLEFMLGNVRNRLQGQGMSLEMLGLNEESFAEQYQETAERQVKGSLILEAVARQEDLKVEEQEIEEKLEQIAQMSNAPLDAVKNYYGKGDARLDLVSQVLEEKSIALLLEKAVVEEVSKEELAEAEPAADKE